MKKQVITSFILAALLTGCSSAETTTENAADTTEMENANFSSSEAEIPEEEGLNAIAYEGVCYYGMAFYDQNPIAPEDAVLLGNAAESSSCQSISLVTDSMIPTEELQTNCGDPGTEVFATYNSDGKIDTFYTSSDGENGYTYYALRDLSTETPSYYTSADGE